jgi:hypothetical protein
MESTERQVVKDLFSRLDGTPSHILIVVGLALALFAPLVLNFKVAGLASAQAELDKLKTFRELDLEEFKRQQQEERKNSPEVVNYNRALEERKPVVTDVSMTITQREDLQKQEEANNKRLQDLKKAVDEKDKERQKASEKKQEELDKKYDTIPARRVVSEEQTAVAGTRSHLMIGWLGHLLLLLGLLVLTFQSEGVRQKVLLVVLLVVMFSALSGVNLNFLARGSLGEAPSQGESSLPGATPPSRPPR